MVFRWRADDGRLIVVFGSSHLSSTKKKKQKKKKKKHVKVGPPLTKFSGSAHAYCAVGCSEIFVEVPGQMVRTCHIQWLCIT